MDPTKDLEWHMKVPGLRLRRMRCVSRSSEDIIMETSYRKMCKGSYCDSDASHNLHLTHVTIFSDNGRICCRKLRRCWIKSRMIRDICFIESNEDADWPREGKVTDRNEHRGNVYANEETWNNRAEAQKRCEDSATRRHENVTLSEPECSVDLSRITCDRKESWGNDDKQWNVIDDYSECACGNECMETTLWRTGVHVWKHITPVGKSWDAYTVDSISDVDVRRAAMDVHWRERIITNSKACHS